MNVLSKPMAQFLAALLFDILGMFMLFAFFGTEDIKFLGLSLVMLLQSIFMLMMSERKRNLEGDGD